MFVNEKGEFAGSVSGGCVENEVIKTAGEVLQSREPKLLSFGIENEDAWSVGLSCGGKISVYVEPFWGADIWNKIGYFQKEQIPAVLITRIGDQKSHSIHTEDEIPGVLREEIIESFHGRKHLLVEKGGKQYFIQLFPRKDQLLIIGAAHVTTELVKLGKMYDFETVVIDPRQVFTEKSQFPEPPDQLLLSYPSEILKNFMLDQYTYAAILSHDPKIDDNALEILLRSGVAYIGALGSRKTHEKRKDRLKEKGFPDREIDRIHAPIGVNIRTKAANEIALSIIAEIVGIRNSQIA